MQIILWKIVAEWLTALLFSVLQLVIIRLFKIELALN